MVEQVGAAVRQQSQRSVSLVGNPVIHPTSLASSPSFRAIASRSYLRNRVLGGRRTAKHRVWPRTSSPAGAPVEKAHLGVWFFGFWQAP